MVQLKTEEKYKWGQTNILPFVGVTKISDEGIIEVPSQEIAEQLTACEIGFQIVAEVVSNPKELVPSTPPTQPLQPQVENDELGKTDVDELGGKEDEKDSFEGSANVIPSEEETIDIKITEEDLNNNPDLKEEGVKVGDTIQIEKSDIVDPTEVESQEIQTISTLSSEEKVAFIAELEKMTLAQLKEQAKPFKPSSEWRNLSKEDLKQYLISKF